MHTYNLNKLHTQNRHAHQDIRLQCNAKIQSQCVSLVNQQKARKVFLESQPTGWRWSLFY